MLIMYTIYRPSREYPQNYVVRRWAVGQDEYPLVPCRRCHDYPCQCDDDDSEDMGSEIAEYCRAIGALPQSTRPRLLDVEPCAITSTLAEAREAIPVGLVCLTRDVADDPAVVETWL